MNTQDAQVIPAVLGTAAGGVSAYYAYLQHQKSRAASTSGTPVNPATPKETKRWSTAVDKAIENFRKGRRECHIEIAQQKNFDKRVDRFSTSELILHVKYPDAGDGEAASVTYRFDLKINKDGDILEMESKGKRSTDEEKFH